MHKKRGFTLVEMAVVLLVMGLVGLVFYGFFIRFVGDAKEEIANRDIERVSNLVKGYVIGEDGGLPTDVEYADLGAETDSWGLNYVYIHDGALEGADDIATNNNAALIVNIYSDANFGAPDLLRTVSDVVFLVVSLGPNNSQDYTITGNTIDILSEQGARQNTTTGRTYDDIVEFVTLNELKALIDAFEQ